MSKSKYTLEEYDAMLEALHKIAELNWRDGLGKAKKIASAAIAKTTGEQP